MSNLMRLTEKGQIAPLPIGPDLEYWSELFTHLLEESGRRGGIPQNALKELQVVNATYPEKPKAVAALSSISIPSPGSCFVKFTKSQYAKEFVFRGKLRIAPASYYADPTLNQAIRDDELSVTAYFPRDEVKIEILDGKTGVSKGKITPTTDLKRCVRSSTDYYVWCVARSLDLRLFDDFESDACVIIKDKQRFLDLLKRKMGVHLVNWCFWNSAVNYFDPYLIGLKQDIDPYFSKHFRYWYQREHRFLWLPPETQSTPLCPIDIELGSLEDIVDYVQL